jgi:hypothetical protein
MRETLLLSINVLMLLAIAIPASSDEIQKMTVAELVEKCTTADPTPAAFCNGLAAGVLNQLQANGLIFNMEALGLGAITDDTRKILKTAGAACGAIEPKLALMAFINWAKFHPEFHRYNGITGVATAIGQAWPCK